MYDLLLMCNGIYILPACCNFGLQPDCRFPCHCAGGGVCHSLTGECRGSGECERSQPESDRIETGWTGPGCQTGGTILCNNDSYQKVDFKTSVDLVKPSILRERIIFHPTSALKNSQVLCHNR